MCEYQMISFDKLAGWKFSCKQFQPERRTRLARLRAEQMGHDSAEYPKGACSNPILSKLCTQHESVQLRISSNISFDEDEPSRTHIACKEQCVIYPHRPEDVMSRVQSESNHDRGNNRSDDKERCLSTCLRVFVVRGRPTCRRV